MNILFIHHRYHPNLYNWFRGFQENRHTVKLLVYKPDEINQPDLPTSNFLPPSKWSRRKMKKNPRTRGDGVDSFSPHYYPSFRTLYKYFKTARPDLVVVRPVFTVYGYSIVVLSLLFRCRIVFHSRIRIHRAYSPLKLSVFKASMWLLNAYWMSPCKGDDEAFKLASKRLVYFPFVIEPQVEGREYLRGSKVNILCVAKYFKSKNPFLILEVFLELKKSYENISLTICGTGDEKGRYIQSMLDFVYRSSYVSDIQLLINQPFATMQDLYRSHDIFVLPTNHDPASFTVLEAMSYGLATITTDVDGSSSYIQQGVNGYVFRRSDKQELFARLVTLISNPTGIAAMGVNSLNIIKQRHSPMELTAAFLKNVFPNR